MHSAHRLAAGAEIRADVCVIGGGPSGMAVSLELLQHGLQVCMVESGEAEASKGSQDLADGETLGQAYYPLPKTRYRALGGSSHLWISGRAHPLQPLDFERRRGIPYSGWPIDREHLGSFYRRAHELLDLGRYDYDVGGWATPEAPPLPLPPRSAVTALFRFGPLDSILRRRRRVIESKGATVLVDATALELVTDDSGHRVEAVIVAAAADHRLTVRARLFVLACGGIDNARLLLLSRRRHRNGLGNGHDLVGRFFMEHPHVRSGVIQPASLTVLDRLGLYHKRTLAGGTAMGKISPHPDLLRDRQLLHSTWALRAVPAVLSTDPAAAVAGLREAPRRVGVPDTRRRLRTLVANPLSSAAAARQFAAQRHRALGPARNRVIELRAMCEQAPNPASRVSLAGRRDRFGQPMARLDWRLTDLDRRSIRAGQDILDHAFREAGLGSVTSKFGDEDIPVPIAGGMHHMGTTRMHPSPRSGVVDTNCRVHEVANLYIAGSSVFPTVGYANPTLTIVALAVRLADHLRTVA